MKDNIRRALEEAEKRLEELLPDIEERQKKAAEKGLEEPDHLRSGISIDELELKRAIKEQEEDEDSTR